jgi:hypothetical protein
MLRTLVLSRSTHFTPHTATFTHIIHRGPHLGKSWASETTGEHEMLILVRSDIGTSLGDNAVAGIWIWRGRSPVV